MAMSLLLRSVFGGCRELLRSNHISGGAFFNIDGAVKYLLLMSSIRTAERPPLIRDAPVSLHEIDAVLFGQLIRRR